MTKSRFVAAIAFLHAAIQRVHAAEYAGRTAPDSLLKAIFACLDRLRELCPQLTQAELARLEVEAQRLKDDIRSGPVSAKAAESHRLYDVRAMLATRTTVDFAYTLDRVTVDACYIGA